MPPERRDALGPGTPPERRDALGLGMPPERGDALGPGDATREMSPKCPAKKADRGNVQGTESAAAN